MTTENHKVQLEASLDASGVRQGAEEGKQAVRGMASEIERASTQAGKSTEKIGDGAANAATKIDAETKKMAQAIERATAAAKAGERGTAAYYEAIANARGVNTDALKPYLDGLRQAEAAQRAAQASLGGMQMSAKQTTAALRQVPMQFTDIFTSLAAGQQPLTVLLQQGGQLKDTFGGVGAAAQALGGYVVGLINPFTLLAAGVGTLAVGFYKGSQEAQEFNKALILSGNQAGLVSSQFTSLAASVSALSNGSIGRSSDAITMLASAGVRGEQNMRAFAAAAVQLERVGGPAIDKTAQAFAELAKAPYEASVKLNESMNYLSSSTLQQVKALQDQGRAVEAADVAQRAYADAIKDRAPAILDSLGDVERAWLAIKKVGGEAVDQILSVGRPGDIEGLRKQIEDGEARLASYGGKRLEREKQILVEKRAQLAALLQGAGYEAVSAFQQAEAANQRRAATEWLKEGEKYLSKQAQMELEIARARNVGAAAGAKQEEVEKRIAAIREKYASKAAVDNSAQRELEAQAKLMAELSGLSGEFFKDWERLNTQFKAGKINTEQLTEAQAKLLAKQPAMRDELKAQEAAQKAIAKAQEEVSKAYDKQVEALLKSADAAEGQLQKAQDEEQAAMIAAAANISLAQAIQQVTIARLQEKQAAEAAAGNQEAVDAIQKEIEARQKLAGLIGTKDARDASEKAAKKAAEDWQKAAEKIEDAITDSLMRGFESGKGFAENLKDTVENMFKTMVLRPIVSAIVQPMAQQLTGSMGLVNSAANAYGMVSGASSLSLMAANATGAMGGDALGSLIASNAGNWGVLSAGVTAGSTALGSVATAVPYLAAAYAIYSIAKSLDDSGTIHTGASSEFSASGGLSTGMGVYGVGSKAGSYGIATEAMTTQVTQSIVGILDSTASTFGKEAGYSAAAAFADDTSKDGAWGALSIKIGDKIVEGFGQDGNGRWPGQSFSDGQAGTQEYLAAVSADVRAALDQIGLPDWAKTMLNQLGDAPALDQLAGVVATINATQTALSNLGKVMPQFAGLTDAATQSLLKSFNGIDGLAGAADGFYANFYSEADRAKKATELVSAALSDLGYAMPKTRDEFRAWVNDQLALGESGAKTAAELLKLQGSVAALVPWTGDAAAGIDEAAKALEEMVEAGKRALASLAEDRGSLMVDLLNAQGKSAEAQALARQQAIDRITAGLTETDKAAAIAAYDYNQAIRDQIAALLAATDAQKQAEAAAKQAADAAIAEAQARARAVEQEGYGLTTRLLQSQGNTAELRRRELEALDPTNRALLEQIFALEDQKAAADAAAKAADEAARAQAKAAEDATRAAEQQAQAAERFRDAWQSVTDSLMDEVARIRGMAAGDAGMTYQIAAGKFSSTTSLARAGDQEAAKLLPELSRTMLTLAEAQATSLAELQRIRARTASSLEQTSQVLAGQFGLSLPKFDVGTNYVPQTMAAIVHKGEAIVPAAYNPAAGGSSGRDDELVAEIRALREENRTQALRLVQLQSDMNKRFKDWDSNGLPRERIEA